MSETVDKISALKEEMKNIQKLYIEEFEKVYKKENLAVDKIKRQKRIKELSTKYGIIYKDKENELYKLQAEIEKKL